MVGWGFAFKKGVILWLWCILWVIVGTLVFVIISVGSSSLLIPLILNPTPESLTPEALLNTMPQVIIGIVAGILASSFIAVIGMFASIVKVVGDAVGEQMRKESLAEAVREPTAPTPASITQYCPNCRRQIVDPSVVYCPDCGVKITE